MNVPRRAQYLHNAWKRHQDAVYWVDIDLATQKGLKFYQTRSNAIILRETLPAYCIPKVVRLKNGEVLYEKVSMSPRPPPKISLNHEWTKELGSEEGEVARQPEGEVARQAKFFQPTQPTPSPIRDRSGRPDVSEDMMSLNVEQTHDRTVRPVAVLHAAAAQDDSQVCHEADTLNVDDEVLRKRMENPLLFMTRIMNR